MIPTMMSIQFRPQRLSPVQRAILESLKFGRQDTDSLQELFFIFHTDLLASEVHELCTANILKIRLPSTQVMYSDDMARLLELSNLQTVLDAEKWVESSAGNDSEDAWSISDPRIISEILHEAIGVAKPYGIAGRIVLNLHFFST